MGRKNWNRPGLARLGDQVLAGRRPDVDYLLELLQSGKPEEIDDAVRFVRWATAHGQSLVAVLGATLDQAMRFLIEQDPKTSATSYAINSARRWMSVIPQERPSQVRVDCLLTLVRWPRESAEWPDEQWALNRHAAQVLMRLNDEFGPLIPGETTRNRVQAVAGTDFEARWAAVIDLANLRLAPGRIADMPRLQPAESFMIPPADSVPRCPCCHSTELAWLRERSPEWTWHHLCGRDWLLWVCIPCRVRVWSKLVALS